jgi:hypothetical protein
MRTLLLALPLLLLSYAVGAAEDRWWRGNTHVHTELCGHADSSPEAVATWYLERGYHFLVLSEHDRFIDPANVVLPKPRRPDFILVPGEELSKAAVHMTAMNIHELVQGQSSGTMTDIIQQQSDDTRKVGGIPIINHPNYNWALKDSDIRPVKRCYLFELYNGHPTVHNEGDATHPSTEAMWDHLLSDGMVIYGVSSDDAHAFKTIDLKKSNPGRGWVMVRAPVLTPDAIEAAFERGDFYASSGVFLAEVAADAKEYRVAVDAARTGAEIAAGSIVRRVVPAAEAASAKIGWRIEFIGPGGAVVHAVSAERASCPRDARLAYLRCRATFTSQDGDRLVQVSAWTQPVFSDGRLMKVEIEAVRPGWAKAKRTK